MKKQVVYVGADHAGFVLKEKLKKFLTKKGHAVVDVGAHEYDKTDDYPVFAYKVAKAVSKGKGVGVLVCGSAEGVGIAANKIKKIRAVPVWTVQNAKLSRQHNDANVLCLSGWQLSFEKAKKIVLTWLRTPFSGVKRHERRINEIKRIEQGRKPK